MHADLGGQFSTDLGGLNLAPGRLGMGAGNAFGSVGPPGGDLGVGVRSGLDDMIGDVQSITNGLDDMISQISWGQHGDSIEQLIDDGQDDTDGGLPVESRLGSSIGAPLEAEDIGDDDENVMGWSTSTMSAMDVLGTFPLLALYLLATALLVCSEVRFESCTDATRLSCRHEPNSAATVG